MNEQLKDRIYDRFYWELRENIVFDEHFHIDFTIKENGSSFEFVSTMYAEQGEVVGVFDYDTPEEYSSPCISCIFSNLVEITSEGDVHYWTDESEEIVYKAIENYRR